MAGGSPITSLKLSYQPPRPAGNRAPLGMFFTTASMTEDPTQSAEINDFLDYALTNDNVFLVTIQQVRAALSRTQVLCADLGGSKVKRSK